MKLLWVVIYLLKIMNICSYSSNKALFSRVHGQRSKPREYGQRINPGIYIVLSCIPSEDQDDFLSDIELDSILANSVERSQESEQSKKLMASILNEVEENRPSDLEVRLQLMGFTPITFFGYGVAIIVIILNTSLGSGWLADLLGMNQVPTESGSSTILPALNDGVIRQNIPTILLNAPENLLR